MRVRIPPPLAMLLAAGVMWALHRWSPVGRLIVAPWNYLGLVPAALGRVISVAAGTRFRQAQTTFDPFSPLETSSLVTEGVFRISRNPMYLGSVLLLLGWAIWLGTLSPWIVPPLFAIGIYAVNIVPEERALEKVFGERYLQYRRNVGRWIGGRQAHRMRAE